MKYFSEQELRCKHGSRACRESGQLPPLVRENIIALVDNVLDPLRDQYGKPIYISSGYRCPKNNTAVGGASNSQHMRGEACDIHAGSPAENLKLAKIIAQQNNFDQMILYVNSSTSLEPRFVHVSYKRIGKNRHCILKKIAGHTNYKVVLRTEIV